MEKNFGLSSREVEIATMIRQGLSTKAIAQTLDISQRTTENHRNNIRRKMGIEKTSTNLNQYLLSL
jgi:DNA-binding NarL/FixJ family response regulator